jgi:hypothetical protein
MTNGMEISDSVTRSILVITLGNGIDSIRALTSSMHASLVAAIQSSTTIDWPLKASARATLRSKVRRLLSKYDCPPDHHEGVLGGSVSAAAD